MAKKTKKHVLAAIGTGVAIGFASMSVANAASDPFTSQKLDSGYNLSCHLFGDKCDKCETKCGKG